MIFFGIKRKKIGRKGLPNILDNINIKSKKSISGSFELNLGSKFGLKTDEQYKTFL